MDAISGLLGLAGIVLVAIAMLDVLWTTLSMTGGGPLSTGLAREIWRSVHGLRHWTGASSTRLLQLAGPGILLSSLLLWIVLLWVGWTLLFSAAPDAVRALQTGSPASLAGRVYFTGYTLFTLGIGNYVPAPGVWEIATAIASLNGLFLITLSITYLVAVLSAATRKHQLATVIATLGRTPHDIVRRAWTEESSTSFSTHLAQVVPMIEMHARSHLAYPVLHYFHSPDRRAAVSLRLAALDDALLLMKHGLAPGEPPDEETLAPAREAIGGVLSTLHGAFIHPDGGGAFTAVSGAAFGGGRPGRRRRRVRSRVRLRSGAAATYAGLCQRRRLDVGRRGKSGRRRSSGDACAGLWFGVRTTNRLSLRDRYLYEARHGLPTPILWRAASHCSSNRFAHRYRSPT